jgi:flagellar hook-associated protein 2
MRRSFADRRPTGRFEAGDKTSERRAKERRSMAGAINFTGLATGLDSKAIIDQLMALERQPLQRLQEKRATLTAQQNDLGGLRSKLTRLQTATAALDKAGGLALYTSTVSDEDKIGVSASGKALPGTHTLNVTQLAEAKTGASTTAYADVDTTKFGSGTVTFVVNGVEKTVNITANQNDTLAGIRDAINAADAGVQASTIYDGTGYRLALTSTKTGLDNAFTSSSTFSFLNEGTGFSQLSGAKNALFTLDGLAVSSQTNTVENSLEGVALTLKNTGTNLSFTVARDTTKIGDVFKEFVDAYNDVQSTVKAGASKNNATLSTVGNRLRGTFSELLSSSDFSFVGLSQLGVTTDATGAAKLDRTKLETAIKNDFAGVVAAVQGSLTDTTKTGIADRFKLLLEGDTTTTSTNRSGLLTSGSGLLAASATNITDRIRRIDDDMDRQQRRLDKSELALRKRFADLEQLTARYQAQGSALNATR